MSNKIKARKELKQLVNSLGLNRLITFDRSIIKARLHSQAYEVVSFEVACCIILNELNYQVQAYNACGYEPMWARPTGRDRTDTSTNTYGVLQHYFKLYYKDLLDIAFLYGFGGRFEQQLYDSMNTYLRETPNPEKVLHHGSLFWVDKDSYIATYGSLDSIDLEVF